MQPRATTAEIANFEEALASLGVDAATLEDAQRSALDRDGFVVLREVLAPARLDRLREQFDREAASDRPAAPNAMREEKGTRHVVGLLDQAAETAEFRRAAFHPRVLAAVMHVLRRPFRIGGLYGREPLEGFGQQGLHADWMAPARKGEYAVTTAIWLLDDFDLDNGATRVVPGTHRRKDAIDKSLAQPEAHHAREFVIRAQAGSVLVFNGHLLHSGTRNRSGARRRALHATFVAEGLPWLHEEPAPAAARAAFSPAEQWLIAPQAVDPGRS